MQISRHVSLAGVLGLALSVAAPAVAQDAASLRQELEQMRKQFQDMQQQHQKAIDAMAERIQKLEARPEAVATTPPPVPLAVQSPPGAPPPSAPSALDLLRRREPFALYGTRGAGQLLFDMGVAGDFVANFTSRRVERAGVGTFAGRENRFFPREIELNLFGQIDPYARAEVRIETGEEAAKENLTVKLAEANLTLLTLPWGLQAKLGQVRNRFGLVNRIHEHDMPQIDRPSVYRAFFGEEGLVERGVEVTWVPDLPVYLEGLVGVFNGDNEVAFGKGRIRDPLVTARLRTFFELGATGGIQLGASLATGLTADELRQTIIGVEAKYKYRPEGWLHPLLTLAGEALFSKRRTHSVADPDDPESPILERTVNRFGWYTYAEIQPWRRWAGGVRYDRTELLLDPGREWSVEPYVTFLPSEFLRFRLAYRHTNRSESHPLTVVLGRRSFDELLLEATFILGAHPAHPF